MSVDGLDRLDAIKARVQSDGRVRVVELASELDVSEMTIRRDLDLLAEQGVLQRVRGGARAVGPQPFAARYGQHARAKERIATKLLALVGDGGAIALDASTTVQRLARVMADVRDVTVLTNGPETFRSLQAAPGITPLLTGGQLDPRTGSLVGPLAVRSAHDLLLRRVFVSAAGLLPALPAADALAPWKHDGQRGPPAQRSGPSAQTHPRRDVGTAAPTRRCEHIARRGGVRMKRPMRAGMRVGLRLRGG